MTVQRVMVDGQVADMGRDKSADGPHMERGEGVAVHARRERRLAG